MVDREAIISMTDETYPKFYFLPFMFFIFKEAVQYRHDVVCWSKTQMYLVELNFSTHINKLAMTNIIFHTLIMGISNIIGNIILMLFNVSWIIYKQKAATVQDCSEFKCPFKKRNKQKKQNNVATGCQGCVFYIVYIVVLLAKQGLSSLCLCLSYVLIEGNIYLLKSSGVVCPSLEFFHFLLIQFHWVWRKILYFSFSSPTFFYLLT